MVFSSIVFLAYFLPLFFLIYYLADRNYKNGVLLISSIFFYAWGAPLFIFVILGTTLIDFHLVRWMASMNNIKQRKLLLTLSLLLNVGLLFYFKYFNFFIDNINVILSALKFPAIQWTKLILPIGISFYTFETITYVVDVYRRVHAPLKKFWDYQLYIIFFPKLIAGPIVRFHEIADQLLDRSANDTLDYKLTGFYRFAMGLAKKTLIANPIGIYADVIFNTDYSTLNTGTAWLGILAYTFQLYFDFSGYSDMAIGLARMLSFKLPENFNNPYISKSITEFWRRWHMTLGNWMKNYLYIPLGGNKVHTKSRLYFNLWIVFLASGFWHGASWTFIIWGAYHGLFLVLERAFLMKWYEKIGPWLSMFISFLIVVVGWVFFRVEKLSNAWTYLHHLFSYCSTNVIYLPSSFYFYLLLAFLFSWLPALKFGRKLEGALYAAEHKHVGHIVMTTFSLTLFILGICSVASADFNPFIYFRF